MTRKYQKEKYNNRYVNEKSKFSEKAGGVEKKTLYRKQNLLKRGIIHWIANIKVGIETGKLNRYPLFMCSKYGSYSLLVRVGVGV